MLAALLFVLGIGTAHASDLPIKEFHGKCVNSNIKSIQGEYKISCHVLYFQYDEKNHLSVVMPTDNGTQIEFTIDAIHYRGTLVHTMMNTKTYKDDVHNKCNMNKNVLNCYSIENNDVIFNLNFVADPLINNR